MSCSHYEERVEKVELPQLKVNGMAIGEDLLARELQYHPADSYALALEAACRALIVRQLLLQRADALGIEPAAKTARRRRKRASANCWRKRCRSRKPTKTPAGPGTRPIRGACSAPGACNCAMCCWPARRTTWKAARRRASRPRSCSTSCAGIPSASSTWPGVSPPAVEGVGWRPWLDRAGQTVPEFEKRLLRRAPGLLEHPLESRYGLHVVELLAREGGEPLDFDAARAQIAAHLQAQVLQRAVGQYIGVLAGDACIEGFAFEGADGALVQ